MVLKKLQIIYDNPQSTYFSGQTVSGKLEVEVDQPKKLRSIVIKFKGEAHVSWTETRRRSSHGHRQRRTRTQTVTYTGHEPYFESTLKVFGGSAEADTLLPGSYTYPFSFVLPPNLPSSFEGRYGYIRYTVKATLDRPWRFDHEAKSVFTVISHVDLNMDPHNREAMRSENSKHFGCLCCKSGPISVVGALPARGFVPGQHVPFTVEVDNASGVQLRQVVIELQKHTQFHATSPPKTKHELDTVLKIPLEGPMSGQDCRTWTKSFQIPPLPPSQLLQCRIIDLQYFVKVVVKPRGMHRALTLQLPVTLGTIPLLNMQPTAWTSPTVPSAPPLDMDVSATYPNLPPPSYEECTFGTTTIGDADDNEYVHGITAYNPRYPTYNFSSQPPPYSSLEPK